MSSTGARYDINIVKGEGFYLDLSVKNCSGDYINLSGYTGYAGLVVRYGDTGILCRMDVTFTNEPSGGVRLSIPQTGTQVLPVTQGRIEFQLTDAGGVSTKYLNGLANISPEVISWN